MIKPKLTMANVQQLHRDGRLEEAELGYMDLLNENPDDVAVLHLLGVLHAENGNLEAAQHFLEKAIQLQPHHEVIALHLANILKAKGLFSQAAQVLKELIDVNPHFAAAFNNLGTVYFAQEKWMEAVDAYRAAISLQANYADAYYNLGLALNKLERKEEAIHVYQSLIELSPRHTGAQFQLGCLLMKENQYQEAVSHFEMIEQEHPFHFETQSNLAACYLKQGWLDKAKIHYLKALNIMPNDIQILFNLGVISMQQGLLNEAIDYYLRVVQINPESYEAHNNLGVAYLSIKNTERALWHFRAALRIDTHDEAVRHTINILMRDKPITTSPPEYIRALFDSYADHFDAHLIQELDYQVPHLVQDVLQVHTDLSQPRWDVLDLGCGTGLCGEVVRSVSRSLVGVDLSEKMLEVAAEKHIYDQLVKSDVLFFLANKNAEFDLIIAGDLLVYFGELRQLFSHIHQALRPNGLFLFNAEINEKEDYVMSESGRFKHSKGYLDQLITQNQFQLLSYQVVRLRTQNQQPVEGHLYLVKKESHTLH